MNAEQVLPFVSKGCITWTMTTIGYVKYTLNLVKWLERIRVPWTLCVICCDPESELFFRREQIPCIQWKIRRRTQEGMAAFGTPSFEVCNRDKLDILKWFTLKYREVGIEQSLYLDGDIVVQKDPWPVLSGLGPGPDLAFQCDCSHEEEVHECQSPCSGVIWTRHTSVGQAAIYEIDEALWKAAGSMDQYYIMKTLALTKTSYILLDRRQFGNGVWQKTGRWKDGDWTLLHYNYMVSSSKRTAMKNAEHWLINH